MMRIGFAKTEITPPLGTELGGYAGYRPCTGVHDPLFCKAVVIEQDGVRYALLVLDLMCADEMLRYYIAEGIEEFGIHGERLIVSAIHSHAAPQGILPGEGPLAAVNKTIDPVDPGFPDYIRYVIDRAVQACAIAVEGLEAFQVRHACGPVPPVGSERHTGQKADGNLTIFQFRTQSGRVLTVYNFPCHPTVMSAENTLVSADFAGGIEEKIGGDMAMFVNGAAGDISTRFTRRTATFEECGRMAEIAAAHVRELIGGVQYRDPDRIRGICTTVTLTPRKTEKPEQVQKQLDEFTAQWKAAEAAGADPATLRILKTYVEGAGVNLQFARSMGDIRKLELPMTVFRFCGINFAAVPGELFSTLKPSDVEIIAYANGYYRYITGEAAYENGYYEAMAAILARGEGERLAEQICMLTKMLTD